MACFSPLSAWRMDTGEIKFAAGETERARGTHLEFPCRQCSGCRLAKASEWSLRMQHEQRYHGASCFVTLTYADEHLPALGDLRYADIQTFHKRVRKAKGPFRFYVCGEYGERTHRAHWHAAVFGIDFERGDGHGRSEAGTICYRSAELEKLWQKGFVTIGDLTPDSCNYVARYVTKKLTGDLGKEAYTVVDPDTGEIMGERQAPFARMSTRPGIGAQFADEYAADMLSGGCIVQRGGTELPIPAYYERRYMRDPRHADRMDEHKAARSAYDARRAWNTTPDRLEVRRVVLAARTKSLKRR